jgi:hypothetical protein
MNYARAIAEMFLNASKDATVPQQIKSFIPKLTVVE